MKLRCTFTLVVEYAHGTDPRFASDRFAKLRELLLNTDILTGAEGEIEDIGTSVCIPGLSAD
jgi:hypothetical protein